jgi:hypothetical protein
LDVFSKSIVSFEDTLSLWESVCMDCLFYLTLLYSNPSVYELNSFLQNCL